MKEMPKSRKTSRSSPTRRGAEQGCQRLREDGALRAGEQSSQTTEAFPTEVLIDTSWATDSEWIPG